MRQRFAMEKQLCTEMHEGDGRMENRINNRFRNVKPDTVNLYCDLFGYESIIISEEESQWLKFADYKEKVVPGNIGNGKSHLLLKEGQKAGCQRVIDVIPIQQLAIDLETIAEIPKYLLNSINREVFLHKIQNYIKGFEKRGWFVVINTRISIQKELNRYQTLENAEILPEHFNVLVVCDEMNEGYADFYEKEKKKRRVECYWLIYFLREWLNELLVRYYRYLFQKDEIMMCLTNCAWAFDHFLGKNRKINSHMIDKRKEYSLDKIQENPQKKKEFLANVLECGQGEALARFEKISKTPLVMEIAPSYVKHADVAEEFLNVQDGCRKTIGTPEDFQNTIWIFGGCVIFGYAVEDDGTIASQLQKILNQKYTNKWRVVNLGIWGGNFDKTHLRLTSLPLRKGDIVVVSHAMGNILLVKDVLCLDISQALNDDLISEDKFWDRVVHCGRAGYAKMAEVLVEKMKGLLERDITGKKEICLFKRGADASSIFSSGSLKELKAYLNEIKEKANWDEDTSKRRVGAIVMNANPFTLGHHYLIQQAASKVDFLYVFVVEEDRSFFPFKERIELVRKGTSHLKNVGVFRSGTYMISSVTFPGYFQKDTPEHVDIDSTSDVEIFARVIAPSLGISVRFVGEEPIDFVTRGYNEKMKEILPGFGIELEEIPRKQIQKECNTPISASLVRKYLQVQEFEKIREIVPETTYQYLVDKYNADKKNTKERGVVR